MHAQGKRLCRDGEIIETYKDWRKRGKFKAIKSQINWQIQYPFMLLEYLFTSGNDWYFFEMTKYIKLRPKASNLIWKL